MLTLASSSSCTSNPSTQLPLGLSLALHTHLLVQESANAGRPVHCRSACTAGSWLCWRCHCKRCVHTELCSMTRGGSRGGAWWGIVLALTCTDSGCSSHVCHCVLCCLLALHHAQPQSRDLKLCVQASTLNMLKQSTTQIAQDRRKKNQRAADDRRKKKESRMQKTESGFFTIVSSVFCVLHSTLHSRFWKQSSGFWILSAGFWILFSQLCILSSAFWFLSSVFSTLSSVFCLLYAGFCTRVSQPCTRVSQPSAQQHAPLLSETRSAHVFPSQRHAPAYPAHALLALAAVLSPKSNTRNHILSTMHTRRAVSCAWFRAAAAGASTPAPACLPALPILLPGVQY